jgi:hypothetical protein
MPSLFFICPKIRQQADTGILTDVESLRDTWSMTLNVNCPHCGEMHAVSVRETYIDDAIRNVSEIARRPDGPAAPPRPRENKLNFFCSLMLARITHRFEVAYSLRPQGLVLIVCNAVDQRANAGRVIFNVEIGRRQHGNVLAARLE